MPESDESSEGAARFAQEQRHTFRSVQMLPNLQTFFGIMIITAVLATLVGLVLVPAPGDPYIQSTAFSRLEVRGGQEQLDWEQARALGYARRVDELNRLFELSKFPEPMKVDEPTSDQDIPEPVRPQSADPAENAPSVTPPRPAPTPDEGRAVTEAKAGEVETAPAHEGLSAAAGGAKDDPLVTSSIHEPEVASVRSGRNEPEAIKPASEIAPIQVILPPERPKSLAAQRPARKASAISGTRPPASPSIRTQPNPLAQSNPTAP